MKAMKDYIAGSGSTSLMQALLKNQPADRPEHDQYANADETPIQIDRSETPIAQRWVNMSNQLTRSAQRLGLAQKRIMALAIAKNDSKQSAHIVKNRIGGWAIRITAKEYAETYDVEPKNAYQQLRTATDSLIAATWEIIETHHNRKVRTKGSWLYTATYHDGQGMIDLAFHPNVAPHLLALEREFTTYKLKHAAALRSIYSWRLYECLQSWKATGQWIVSLEDFRRIMETPAKYDKDFNEIRRWVINPAVQELIQKNNMLITWTARKEGRQVVELRFVFENNPQQLLELSK